VSEKEAVVIKGLSHVTLLVKDLDEAKQWYTEKLGLEERYDVPLGEDFRWVTVGAKDQKDLEIVLHKPRTPEHETQLGKQALGVFNSDDCRQDVEALRARGVKITGEPEEQMWGIQAIFEDLYGNMFVMVQPPSGS